MIKCPLQLTELQLLQNMTHAYSILDFLVLKQSTVLISESIVILSNKLGFSLILVWLGVPQLQYLV